MSGDDFTRIGGTSMDSPHQLNTIHFDCCQAILGPDFWRAKWFFEPKKSLQQISNDCVCVALKLQLKDFSQSLFGCALFH